MAAQPELRESRVLTLWLSVLCVVAFAVALAWDVANHEGTGTILRDAGLTVMAAAFCWMRVSRGRGS